MPEGTPLTEVVEKDIQDDTFPKSDIPNIRKNKVICFLQDTKSTGLGYIDFTDKFTYQSIRGNNYIMVAYHCDGNTSIIKAIKNRQAHSIVKAWETINKTLKIAGVQPQMYILDNEYSSDLKIAFRKENINFQLVHPAIHRTNAIERAIQTYKNHLKAGLATVDPELMIREWG